MLIVSIFLFNETLRMLMLNKLLSNQTSIWMINILFLISSSLLLITYYNKRNFDNKILFTILILMGLLFMNTIFGRISIISFILFSITYMIPFLLISIKIDNIQNLVKVFLKIFNIIIIILTLYGAVDYFTDGSLQVYMANNWAYGEFQELIYSEHGVIYRMYSFLGHPLSNANLYLIFFVINKVYNRYFEKIYNDYGLLLITASGLVLSGSKTALVLASFLFIFCNGIKKRKYLYYGLMIIVLIALFNTSIFQNNLLKRFQYGIEYNNITSGRNDVVQEVVRLGIKPNFIICGGIDYSRKITISAMTGAENFEYPLLMLSYDYGVFEAILMYYIIFIYPSIIFIKNKNYYILINYLVVFLYVNTNNGLANLGSDSMAIFGFVIMILVNISDRHKKLDESLNKI